MNWIDLKKYMNLSDRDKFVKYATENKLEKSEFKNSPSYFINTETEEGSLENIMIYDFYNIEGIEKYLLKLLYKSNLKNIDILVRITAINMMKNKIDETNKNENEKMEQEYENKNVSKFDNAPPEFYYPM